MKTKKHNYFKYSKRGSLNNSTRLWLVCGSVWSSYCMMSTSLRLKTNYLSKSSKQPLLIIDQSQPLTFSFGILLVQRRICIQQRLQRLTSASTDASADGIWSKVRGVYLFFLRYSDNSLLKLASMIYWILDWRCQGNKIFKTRWRCHWRFIFNYLKKIWIFHHNVVTRWEI